MVHTGNRLRRGGAACGSAVDFIRVGFWLSGGCNISILRGVPMLGRGRRDPLHPPLSALTVWRDEIRCQGRKFFVRTGWRPQRGNESGF
jgi:hypothetical protein